MNYKKLVSIASGISIFAVSLAPMSASALSTATTSLSSTSNATGNFAVTVYEDTGADTVTGAYVTLDFSSAVSNVSYDYSVGPFVATTPGTRHNVYGTVSGQQPVVTVRFTVSNPATITASVDPASYLTHVDGNAFENFPLTYGSASFTYTAAVAVTPTATGSTKVIAPTDSPSTPTTPVAADTTTSTSSNKATKTNKQTSAPKTNHVKSSRSSLVTSTISALVIVAVAVYWLVIRKRVELKPMAAAYKLVGARKHTITPAKKSTNRSKSSAKAKKS